nr:hypothetical protein [Mycoplasmopsis bovis]
MNTNRIQGLSRVNHLALSIWTKRPAPKKKVDPHYEPDEDDDDYEDYN